jgi:hypothetical protein
VELVYASDKVRIQCTSVKAAKKLFGGNAELVKSLFARINALQMADTIMDIIVQPTFHFHKLGNMNRKNLEGFFAIDVKSRKEQWRVILQPLNENKEPFEPCQIDRISSYVRIVEITEVSKHYE